MEFRFSAWEKKDLEISLLVVGKSGTGDVPLGLVGSGISDIHRTAALHLDAVAVSCTCGEGACAKARTGVVNFEELEWGSSVILDGNLNVV
jgi:hypothetical protein